MVETNPGWVTRVRFARSRAFVLTLVTSGLVAACSLGSAGGMVVGSGDVTSETRRVTTFTDVSAGASIQLELATGPQQVVITAQPNIADIATTEVSGSRLTLGTTSGYVTAQGLVVKVTAPHLGRISLTGGASATGAVDPTRDLAVTLSGGARASLSGATTTLHLEASGGALPDLAGLRVTNATVDLSGGVVASVDVSGTISGSASGGVVLNLTRRPASSTVETSGGAVVRSP